jgi:hypothetical protein
MKRRNFLKSTIAVSAGIAVAPNLLLAKPKMKNPCKDISIYGTMPELQPGDVGIIYGLSGSGKSKVMYKLNESTYRPNTINSMLINLEVNHHLRNFEDLKTVLRDYPRENVFIDNVYLIDTPNIVEKLRVIAQKNKSKMWVTLQANRTTTAKSWEYPKISKGYPYTASIIVYVYNEDGHIFGNIIKHRTDAYNHKLYFGEAKYLGINK